MKAKVKMPFRDKETKKVHKKGDTIDVTAKRFNEIIKQGQFLEVVEDTNTTTIKK